MIYDRFIIADTNIENSPYRLVYDMKNKNIKKLNYENLFNSKYTNNYIEKSIYKFNYSKKNDIKVKMDELSSLKILVSNVCNLSCKYCYAGGGSYGQEEKFMSMETADNVCNFLIKKYKKINEVVFFGGEPCMNIPVIEYICNRLNKNYNDKYSIHYSIVTNGTIVNEYLIDIINRYNINVVISLDYFDASLNDNNRMFKNGNGTFNIVSENILKLKKSTNSKLIIETTYTKEHYKNGVTYNELMENFNRIFGVSMFIIQVESEMKSNIITESKYINSFKDNLLLFINKGLVINNIVFFLSNILNAKYTIFYCNAAFGQLAISPIGDIYPCQMFIANNLNENCYKFKLGNVKYDYISEKIYKWFLDNNTKNNETCNCCNCMDKCNQCAFKRFITNRTNLDYCNKSEINNNYRQNIQILLNVLSNGDNINRFNKRVKNARENYNLFA